MSSSRESNARSDSNSESHSNSAIRREQSRVTYRGVDHTKIIFYSTKYNSQQPECNCYYYRVTFDCDHWAWQYLPCLQAVQTGKQPSVSRTPNDSCGEGLVKVEYNVTRGREESCPDCKGNGISIAIRSLLNLRPKVLKEEGGGSSPESGRVGVVRR